MSLTVISYIEVSIRAVRDVMRGQAPFTESQLSPLCQPFSPQTIRKCRKMVEKVKNRKFVIFIKKHVFAPQHDENLHFLHFDGGILTKLMFLHVLMLSSTRNSHGKVIFLTRNACPVVHVMVQ